jgi:hypothetical protein
MFLISLAARVRKVLSSSRIKLHDSKAEETTALKRLRELMEISNSNRVEAALLQSAARSDEDE